MDLMGLVILVLILALVGFLVYIVTTQVPMSPIFKVAIEVVVLVFVILFLINYLGGVHPIVLHR